MMKRCFQSFCSSCIIELLLFLPFAVSAQSATIPFPCAPLTETGDLSAIMVEGIDSFLTTATHHAKEDRTAFWHRDFSSPAVFNTSIATQRQLLSARLGIAGTRANPVVQAMSGGPDPLRVETPGCIIEPVQWKVMEDLWAEGLLLRPRKKARARIVLLPDADITPETLAGLQHPEQPGYDVARRLAEAGAEVLVPVLVNRSDTFSGNTSLHLFTNMPHREWLYRQAYEVGRHVIGYELQKVFSAIDWFELENKNAGAALPIGVGGYGEGGLLALYASAIDTRISSTLVSGYFDTRDQLWSEPIYRNVFGLLKYFGDAEVAVMTWPRALIIEQSVGPEVDGPPRRSKGRRGAAPGRLVSPDPFRSKNEWNRAVSLLPANDNRLAYYDNGGKSFGKPFSAVALNAFVSHLHLGFTSSPQAKNARLLTLPAGWIDVQQRQQRTVRAIQDDIQQVLEVCERTRNEHFWKTLQGDTAMQRPVKADLRDDFWNQIGRLPDPSVAPNTRARILETTEKWTRYEVTLDVWPGVFAWGILVVPTGIREGERRPVVVCQHGLEGVPMDVVTTDSTAENFHFYKGFGTRLAERGYITFAPSHLYRGGDKFRVLQRKANPLGLTLFSVMVGQHQRILEWLKGLSFVDPQRIGFYGLSYGGKSAMRIPAILQGYALSVCSGDFNEWVRKCATVNYPFSYIYNGEYDMQEWDLGHTFNYAEMAALIAPRPFMVERGHFDNVATDEWVGYEFAKVRRHYDLCQLHDRARIEYFAGPHTVHGVGTFKFLDDFLKKGSVQSNKKIIQNESDQ